MLLAFLFLMTTISQLNSYLYGAYSTYIILYPKHKSKNRKDFLTFSLHYFINSLLIVFPNIYLFFHLTLVFQIGLLHLITLWMPIVSKFGQIFFVLSTFSQVFLKNSFQCSSFICQTFSPNNLDLFKAVLQSIR